jgi:hypothetical protein
MPQDTLYKFTITSECYSLTPQELLNKLQDRACRSIYLGWTTNGFSVLDLHSRQAISARTIRVLDGTFLKDEDLKEHELQREVNDEDLSPEGYESEYDDSRGERKTRRNQMHEKRKLSQRQAKDSALAKVLQYQEAGYHSYAQEDIEPETFEEASESPIWWTSMTEEMNSHGENGTWELVSLPLGALLVLCKWVYKLKRNEKGEIVRFKSRLVARGFSQQYGVDFFETFAPVGSKCVLRLLLWFAAFFGLVSGQCDVDTAFLYGELEEEIYMMQPPGFDDGSGKVCKLKKGLYGLKQSPRMWYKRLKTYLESLGFKECIKASCLFFKADIAIYVYVDDLVIIAKSRDILEEFKRNLRKEFKIKDLGRPKFILGVHIMYEDQDILLSQSHYIDVLIDRFGLKDSFPVHTPLDSSVALSNFDPSCDKPYDSKRYHQLIGSLLHLSNWTRPDIAYAVSMLSQYLKEPGIRHWEQAKRVLKYLKNTKDLVLSLNGPQQGWCKDMLGCQSNMKGFVGADVRAFSDSDWAGCLNGRKSRSGICAFLGNGLISWMSKKQEKLVEALAKRNIMLLLRVSQN